MTPESRSGAVIHLKIAAEMAARLLTEPFDDRAEPAPVVTP
jgi:hypothetical protein